MDHWTGTVVGQVGAQLLVELAATDAIPLGTRVELRLDLSALPPEVEPGYLRGMDPPPLDRRALFEAAALLGLLAGGQHGQQSEEWLAREAVYYADRLLHVPRMLGCSSSMFYRKHFEEGGAP